MEKRTKNDITKDDLGQCFTSAFKAADEFEKSGYWPMVVHGKVTGTKGCKIEGVEYIHGWVELRFGERLMCYDSETKILVPSELYYKVGNISIAAKYPMSNARIMTIEHGHYGPWHHTFIGVNEKLIKEYYPERK